MARKRRKDVSGSRDYALLREFKADARRRGVRRAFGAHAMGIGRKIVDGKATDQLALRVYVARKRPESDLAASERIPPKLRFMSRGEGREVEVTTDVIETSPARFEAPTDRVRPAPGGVSVDGISGTAGTLGGWVWDATDDTIVMLSNHHVLGDAAGTDIIQPGPFDGGSNPADKMGDTKRGIPRSTTATNTVDCAIGNPDSSDVYDLNVLDIGPAVYAIDVVVLDMLVEKSGRTTGHTFGEITDTDYETTVDGQYAYDDCIRVDVVDPSPDWSAGGDSGSLVFSQTPIGDGSDIKPVVALHFAGADTYGVGCKIQNVFSQLNLATLCEGAFAAFFDALFEAESTGEVGGEARRRLEGLSTLAAARPVPVAPPPLVARDRLNVRARSLTFGMARDLQGRLVASPHGRSVTGVIDRHRAELLTMLAKDGDVRRATISALRPLVAGATTTTDVLERIVTDVDLQRLEALARELERKGSPDLQKALKPLTALRPKGAGRSIGAILGIGS